MRFQAGIQIILIVIAVVIVTMVIRPKFAEIQSDQNEIASYGQAVDKADAYNALLQEKLNKANNFPRADRIALDKYLPASIDTARVSRDISNIAKKHGLLVQELSSSEEQTITVSLGDVNVTQNAQRKEGTLANEAQNELSAKNFTVEVIGGYTQMKLMLQDIERNAYPLHITEFSFDSNGESVLHKFSLKLETYALNVN